MGISLVQAQDYAAHSPWWEKGTWAGSMKFSNSRSRPTGVSRWNQPWGKRCDVKDGSNKVYGSKGRESMPACQMPQRPSAQKRGRRCADKYNHDAYSAHSASRTAQHSKAQHGAAKHRSAHPFQLLVGAHTHLG